MSSLANNLPDFEIKEVLRNDQIHRMACLHVRKNNDQKQQCDQIDGVLIVQKTPFDQKSIDCLFDPKTKVNLVDRNDIYSNCTMTLPSPFADLKATWICPATPAHINKYRDQPVFFVAETYQNYLDITLPHLTQTKFSTKWVDNILNHKAEMDSVVFEDCDEKTGFMLLPDLKWDRKSIDSLYLTAICKRTGIKSIRDITADHLTLLVNIRDESLAVIKEKYGVNRNQLRIFLHYQPSYYHLHVHFMHVNAEPLGATVGQAHLLDDVIDNLTLMPDFYQSKTLHYTLKRDNPLLAEFIAHHQ